MQQIVKFPSDSGYELAGVVHVPDAGKPKGWALFAHCFTCTKNVKAAVHIAEALCEEGIGVLRFDFTGLGDSEGEFADTHFSSNVADLIAAARYLESTDRAPDLLCGHSLGGTACLAAAHDLPSVRAVATMGSPADADHVLRLLEDDLDDIERGSAVVGLAGRPFTIRNDFLRDIRSQAVRDGIPSLRRALLVMHSPLDELVSIDEASRIFKAAMHPKSFISLDRSDHLLSDERQSRYAGRVMAQWASHYLVETSPSLKPATYEAGRVVVEGRMEDGFTVSVNADGHRLTGDEPVEYGGRDEGPTPYDLLAAALGTCTAMTINMYARRKGLELEAVSVSVSHGKVHAEDCEHCQTETGKIDRLSRRISFEGSLDEAATRRLLEIADRCPVHRTLHSEIWIDSELVE